MKTQLYIFGGIVILSLLAAVLLVFEREHSLEKQISEKELREGTIEDTEEGKRRYTNTTHGFSFIYPREFTVGAFDEGAEGDVVLVQKEADQIVGFQTYITPFDEEWPITPERIHQDVPNLKIRVPQYVVIGGGSIEALIFETDTEVFGKTREAWFLHDGNLYQVTAEAGNDAFIGPILESWRFEDV